MSPKFQDFVTCEASLHACFRIRVFKEGVNFEFTEWDLVEYDWSSLKR